jgi:hypothetical protein
VLLGVATEREDLAESGGAGVDDNSGSKKSLCTFGSGQLVGMATDAA